MSNTTPQKEAEANMFAFELLMPQKQLLQDVEGKDATDMAVINKLARKYQVEPAVMAMRLGQLHMDALK